MARDVLNPALMRALGTILLLTFPLAACGGSVSSGSADGAVGSGKDAASFGVDAATTTRDTGTGTRTDAKPSCTPAFLEAGTGRAGEMELPVYHRASSACCPSDRGPAPGTQPYSSDTADGCTSDSDCTKGANGRCFPFEGLVGAGGCSYDECTTDSDCPSGTPCVCRTSASDDSANACAPGGNCVLDSDCGVDSYCSPSQSCFGEPVYYCHTAADTCINDADCPSVDAGDSCAIPRTCVYDPTAKHWACNQQACCPP